MYINLNDVDTTMIKRAASTINKNEDDYVEIINDKEMVSISKIIELIEDLNYELERLQEKNEEMEEE